MRCICLDCGEVFYEDSDFEEKTLRKIEADAPEWFKDAWFHAVSQRHNVVVVVNVLGLFKFPISLQVLAPLCGIWEEQVAYAYLEDKLKDFLRKSVEKHSKSENQQ